MVLVLRAGWGGGEGGSMEGGGHQSIPPAQCRDRFPRCLFFHHVFIHVKFKALKVDAA